MSKQDEWRALADDWQQQLHDAAMTQSEKDKRERTIAALRYAADRDRTLRILDEQRIERPVPTTDEHELCPACDFDPLAPHNGHGDGCRNRVAPQPPTREQIAEAIWRCLDMAYDMEDALDMADAVLALLHKGGER